MKKALKMIGLVLLSVIVMCNGSGTPMSQYPAVAKHMASWGFIVIGTEENYSWNAFGAEMCLRVT